MVSGDANRSLQPVAESASQGRASVARQMDLTFRSAMQAKALHAQKGFVGIGVKHGMGTRVFSIGILFEIPQLGLRHQLRLPSQDHYRHPRPEVRPIHLFSSSATLQIPRTGRFAVTIRRPQYHWLNMARRFHIAAYDIADPRRLRQSLRVAKEFATGGQRSVFECPLTPAEHDEFTQRISEILDMEEDRFCLLRLEPKARVRTLGIAVPLSNPNYFYAG